MLRLGPALARWTDRRHGDFRLLSDDSPDAEARRRAVVDLPWAWVQQVHGAEVALVGPTFERPATRADALVTSTAGLVLSVRTADCGAVALASPEGVIAAVHVGWRGLLAGVVDRAVGAMREQGAITIEAALGPCIHADCYEFGPEPLALLVERFGPGAQASTGTGTPALDLPAVIESALDESGVVLVSPSTTCTACSSRHWSHRAAGDGERQALAVWLPV